MVNNRFSQTFVALTSRLRLLSNEAKQVTELTPTYMRRTQPLPSISELADEYSAHLRDDSLLEPRQAVPLDVSHNLFYSPIQCSQDVWVVGPAKLPPVAVPPHKVSWWWNWRDGYDGTSFYLDPQSQYD